MDRFRESLEMTDPIARENEMNRAVFIKIFVQPITIVLIVLVTQAMFLTVTAEIGLAQQLSTSAAATPITRAPGGPSSIELKRNWLLQQQATLNQSITVAKACIKNNSHDTGPSRP